MQQESIHSMSTGEILRRLVNNLSLMVDRQVLLAKEEAKSDAVQVGMGAALLVVGGLFGFAVVATLLAAAVLAIFSNQGPVTVALILAAVYLVVAAIFGLIGYGRVKVQPMAKTRQSIKEDVQWARTQVTSQGR